MEEIKTYNELLDKVESQDGENEEWRFKSINDHQGPLYVYKYPGATRK